MSVFVVTPPAELPVTLEEVRRHLRIDAGADDPLISGLVMAATAWLDGPGGWLGRALVAQTLELRQDGFGWCDSAAFLPFPPAIEIVSITYDDAAGIEQTVPTGDYRLLGGNDGLFRVAPAHGKAWPTTRGASEAVRIRYRAGYGAATAVPAPIRQAILLLVGHWYANREAASTDRSVAELPLAWMLCCSPTGSGAPDGLGRVSGRLRLGSSRDEPSVTVAFRKGQVCFVRRLCAGAAIAARKARPTANPNRPPVEIEDDARRR